MSKNKRNTLPGFKSSVSANLTVMALFCSPTWLSSGAEVIPSRKEMPLSVCVSRMKSRSVLSPTSISLWNYSCYGLQCSLGHLSILFYPESVVTVHASGASASNRPSCGPSSLPFQGTLWNVPPANILDLWVPYSKFFADNINWSHDLSALQARDVNLFPLSETFLLSSPVWICIC